MTTLISALQFKYPSKPKQFEIAAGERMRSNAILVEHTEEGRLFKGRRREREYLVQSLLTQMCESWLRDALDNGTVSWDVTLARALSVVLQSALNFRMGDITRAYLCTGNEYLTWGDICLRIKNDKPPSYENLVARVDLRFTKGKK